MVRRTSANGSMSSTAPFKDGRHSRVVVRDGVDERWLRAWAVRAGDRKPTFTPLRRAARHQSVPAGPASGGESLGLAVALQRWSLASRAVVGAGGVAVITAEGVTRRGCPPGGVQGKVELSPMSTPGRRMQRVGAGWLRSASGWMPGSHHARTPARSSHRQGKRSVYG